MRKKSKKYQKPRHPWNWQNLSKEKELKKNYGLKNKKEVWKAQSQVRKYRKIARQIIGQREEEVKRKKENFLKKLRRQGFIKENGGIDDVLSMTTKDYPERRLQTLAWRKGYGRTPKQSRQLITHGHIEINGRKTTKPGIIIPKEEENTIDWYRRPIEQAEASKKPQKKTREQKTMKQKRTKPKKETKEEAEEKDYEKLSKKNISEIKEKSQNFNKKQYEELLETEKQNKDRKTLKKWIKRQINKED